MPMGVGTRYNIPAIGSLLRGLAKRLTEKINIPFYVAEDPLRAVARGTCLALKNTENYTFLMR